MFQQRDSWNCGPAIGVDQHNADSLAHAFYIIIAQVPLSTISLSLRERGVSPSLAILTKIVTAERFLVEVAILDVRLDDSKLSLTASDSGRSGGLADGPGMCRKFLRDR